MWTFKLRLVAAVIRTKEGSSSASMVEVRPELSGEKNAYKENRDIDYDAHLDDELDDEDARYEDDDY